MKVPHRVVGSVRPSQQPFSYLQLSAAGPGAFGAAIGQGLSQFGQGISQAGQILEENRQKESRIGANRQLAEFEIAQNRTLMELIRDSAGMSNIDQTFHDQFTAAADVLLAQAPDEETRQYLENQLIDLYRQMQIQAQNSEAQRNSNAISSELETLFQEAANIVLGDGTKLDEQADRLVAAIAEAEGIVPNQDLVDRTRRYLQGLAESDVRSRIRDNPELVYYELLHGNAMGSNEAALMEAESGGDPTEINDLGYAGLYQFGAPQLNTLGLYTAGPGESLDRDWADHPEERWTGTIHIPGFPEVRTITQFRNNPAAQQAAFRIHTVWVNGQIDQHFAQYIGQTIDGVRITRASIFNMIHLGGTGGARGFLEGTSNVADRNRTTMRDYAMLGSGLIQESGGIQAILSPEQTRSLLSAAESQIAENDRIAAAARNAQIDVIDSMMTDITKEVAYGSVPGFEAVTLAATELGGAEGQAFLQEIEFQSRMADVGSIFALAGEIGRSDFINQMESERRAGTLDQHGVEVLEFLKDIDQTIRTDGETNGYGVAARYGVVQQTVQIDFGAPETIALREQQASAIKLHFGGTASVMTPAERGLYSGILSGPDTSASYALMAALSDAPLLASELQAELAARDTPEGLALAVAFDLAAQGEEQKTLLLLQGQQGINSGLPTPNPLYVDNALKKVLGDAFEGMNPSIIAAYRAAATAYFIGVYPNRGADGAENDAHLRAAVRAVLPGQAISYNGSKLVTPEQSIHSSEWGQLMHVLRNDEEWWRRLVRVDPNTRGYSALTEAPTYPNGDPILIGDLLDEGEIRSFTSGLYRPMPYGSQLIVNGQRVLLDLRGAGDILAGIDRPPAPGIELEEQNFGQPYMGPSVRFGPSEAPYTQSEFTTRLQEMIQQSAPESAPEAEAAAGPEGTPADVQLADMLEKSPFASWTITDWREALNFFYLGPNRQRGTAAALEAALAQQLGVTPQVIFERLQVMGVE